MKFNSAMDELSGDGDTEYVDERASDGALVAETHLKLATLSAILIELSESYYAIVDGAGGCLGGLLRVGELELVVQEALAAYQRQVASSNFYFSLIAAYFYSLWDDGSEQNCTARSYGSLCRKELL